MFKRVSMILAATSLAACGSSGETPPDPVDDPVTPKCVQIPKDWTDDGVQWGTANGDEALDIVISPHGYAYVGGYVDGTVGQATVDPSGDASGVLLTIGPDPDEPDMLTYWEKDFQTQSGRAESIEALTFHPDTGELYFVGRTTGKFSGYANAGKFDYFVGGPGSKSKFDVLYQGGWPSPQHPRQISFDANRDLIIGGYDDIYVPTNYVEAWEDPFVVKLQRGTNGSLSESWRYQANTAYTDLLGGLAVEQEGTSPGIYVSGVNTSGVERGMFVKKLDADGNVLWTHRQSPIAYDMTQSVHLLPDGNLLTASSTFAMLGDAAYGQQDVVVQKLDPETRQALWTFQYGSADTEWVTDMAVDSRGNIFVVGETLGAIERDTVNQGSFDIFMLKVSPDGQLLEARQWGSAGDDHPSAVAVDACGEAFIVGYTTGDLLTTSFGSRDAFIITTAKAPVSTSSQSARR